jgi:hypothetical protein
VVLASPFTGNGELLTDLEAGLLDERVRGGLAGLVDRVEARLLGTGRTLQVEGRPVTEASARRSLLQQTCQTFEEEGLARLAHLGILTAG